MKYEPTCITGILFLDTQKYKHIRIEYLNYSQYSPAEPALHDAYGNVVTKRGLSYMPLYHGSFALN